MKNNFSKFYNKVVDSGLGEIVSKQISLSSYTSYKIGGNAYFFAIPNTPEELLSILQIANDYNIGIFIIGGGTNILVSDGGFDGLCMKLGAGFAYCNYHEGKYDVGASCSLAKLVNECNKNSISGFEFAIGTPGSVGGALKMNAGTKDDWIGSRVNTVKIVNANGEIKDMDKGDILWEYRKTSFCDEDIILSSTFDVTKLHNLKAIENSRKEMSTKIKARRASQPLNYPSCGSVFKNLKGMSAGKLIEDAGLKGETIGGAQISTKHANFIINKNNACASDVVSLINLIQETVYEKFEVKLITEVKFLGFSNNPSLFIN